MHATLSYDPKWQALVWAKEHCPSYITNASNTDGKIDYFFSDERDVVLFLLRWSW